MDYIIETENLTKRYGTATVVDKVNLHVPKGKIYGLLGRNGAGKTTAMKMMLQLAFPTEGTVRLFGTNYKENIHTLYSKVGSIIETPGFYSNLMSTEQTPVFFAAPKYPAMLSKLAKGRTESYGDSARGPTWQSHEQRFPAALQ